MDIPRVIRVKQARDRWVTRVVVRYREFILCQQTPVPPTPKFVEYECQF